MDASPNNNERNFTDVNVFGENVTPAQIDSCARVVINAQRKFHTQVQVFVFGMVDAADALGSDIKLEDYPDEAAWVQVEVVGTDAKFYGALLPNGEPWVNFIDNDHNPVIGLFDDHDRN
jgi:hypothetical protein